MAESTPRTPRPEAPAAAAAASEGIARIAQLARDAGILGNAAEPTPGAERAARQGPPAAAPGATGPAAPEAAAVAAADVVAKAEKDDGLPRPLVPPPHPVDTDEPGPPTRAELAKFSLGPESASEGPVVVDDLDADLAPLAEGYGDRRLFLLPRSPEWLLAMWDFTNDQKDELRRQGGAQLGLRVYDVSPSGRRPPKDHACDELAREYYIPAEPDRRYAVELGYWTRSGGWLSLGRSHDAWTPPSGPRPGPVVFATVPYERVRPAGAPPRYQLPGYVGGVEHGQGQGQGHSSLTQEVAAALDGARRSLGLIRGGPAGPSSASSNRSGTATTSATTTSASSPGGDASGSDSSDAAAAGEAGAVVYPHPLVYPGPEGPLGSSMGVSPSLPPGPGVGPLPSSPSSSWSR